MNYIIETNNLCKSYGKTECVKDLNLHIPEASIYGFLGPNGAGKSTTLKMLLGLIKPTGGSISVFGEEVNSKTLIPILKKTGSLIESPSYYDHLTGYENLMLAATLKDVAPADIVEILDLVHLLEFKDRKTKHYSLGMKQRLGLAIALLGYPKLLILDEPTNGLDPAGIQEMRELILSLPGKYGMSVAVSSHLLAEIDQIADYVGIIHHGQLKYQDTLASLHAKNSENLVITTGQPNIAFDCLSTLSPMSGSSENEILLPMLTDPEVAAIVKNLIVANVDIYRVERRGQSLEEIFLAITEGA